MDLDTAQTRQDLDRVLTNWLDNAERQISTLKPLDRRDMRHELAEVTTQIMRDLGDMCGAELVQRAPRSELYQTQVLDDGITRSKLAKELTEDAAQEVRAAVFEAAEATGIDRERMAQRLEHPAASAWQEREWVKQDLLAVSTAHNLDLDRKDERHAAAELVDRFPGFGALRQDPWRTAYLIVFGGALVLALAGLVFSVTHRLTTYGKAHFQTRGEVRKNGLAQPLGSGLVFGKFGKPEKRNRTGRFVCGSYDQFPHALVIASTRSGKGVGYVIPNTLLFPGSCVVMDVKGEIFEATSRQAQGDRVFRFAPFDFENPTHRYNPLERIAAIADTVQRFTELSKLASYFLTLRNEKGGASDFIVGARQLFVAGGMLAIERKTPTIGAISRILLGSGNKEEAYQRFARERECPVFCV